MTQLLLSRVAAASTVLVAVILSGCFSSGALNAAHVTNVELAEGNFEIVATGVRGQASAAYLLGVSASTYQQMQTLALARVDGSGLLYEDAVADLWENFRAAHGDVEGRNLALVNVVYDAEALNLLVYTRPTVSVRADVIEFIDN